MCGVMLLFKFSKILETSVNIPDTESNYGTLSVWCDLKWRLSLGIINAQINILLCCFTPYSHNTNYMQTRCKKLFGRKSREKTLKEYYLLLKSVQGDFLMTQIIRHFFQWAWKQRVLQNQSVYSSAAMSYHPENFELQSKELIPPC